MKKYPPEPLTDPEFQALLKACSRRAPTGIRNRALLTTLYRGGLRVSEALALQEKDIDLNAGTIRILHGKGDKQRTAGIDAGAGEIIALWLVCRKSLELNEENTPLFCTLQGCPVSAAYVRHMMKHRGRKAGLTKRLHPHGLRHSMAFQLAMENVPIPVIQQQLGHADIGTTSRYLAHVAPAQVIQAMQERKWKAGGAA